MDSLKAYLRFVPVGPLIAVATVAGIWWMSTGPSAVARVPDVRGLAADAAQAVAASSGYTTRITLQSGAGLAGTVLDQEPTAGDVAGKGTAIDLRVSSGAPQVKVPDVRGMPVSEARLVLEETGLEPGDVTYRRSPGNEENRVITTNPRPGATVDASTPVALIAAA